MAMICSIVVNERQRQGKRRTRLDLLNGMRLAPLTTVTDDSRTMLSGGLAPRRMLSPQARTNALPVIVALPFTL
jgi:hypothetical protein